MSNNCYKPLYQLIALTCSLSILAACTITVDPVVPQAALSTAPEAEVASMHTATARVLPTEVTYVWTLATLNIRSGPGLDYAEVSVVEEGQTVPVFGISKDGNWWLVFCPDETVGCWMTAGPSYSRPTSAPDADPLPAVSRSAPVEETGEVLIDDLAVRLLESFPTQLEAVVTGQLPDSCTYIENLDVVREGSTFRILIGTAERPEDSCAPVLVPFEETVPLDVSGLPPGDYEARVNGRVVPFALAVADEAAQAEAAPPFVEAAVVEQIEPVVISDPAQGIQSVNVVVSGYVPDPCTEIEGVSQRQEGSTFYLELTTTRPPGVECAQVITEFERTIPLDVTGLPAGTYEVIVNDVGQTFIWPGPDVPTPTAPVEVPTTSPLETPTVPLPGPTVVATATPTVPVGAPTVVVTGAPTVVVTATPTGTLGVPPSIPTDVTNIVALQDVQIYDGPNTTYGVIGQFRMGEEAGVLGTSEDGTWWRIQCAINPESNCWVTADPMLTQAVDAGE